MGKLKYLVIHCTDTPRAMVVNKQKIQLWHMAPLINADGTVIYKEKKYESVDKLPKENLNGIDIKKITGRGWARIGYSVIVHQTGKIDIMTGYNDDDIVTNDEMTWGAVGINDVARHIVLEGGWNVPNDRGNIYQPEQIYSPEQLMSLLDYINGELMKHPMLIVTGHNRFATKTCPNFDVKKWCLANGINEVNTY